MAKTNEQKLAELRLDHSDIVFGIKWFQRHQRKLLWLLNTPIVKNWFRWVMCIPKYECPTDIKITSISPSNFTYVQGFKEMKNGGIAKIHHTSFRTHDKYAKRLYYAFKPIWYVMHFFDWAMLDRVNALTRLSFGFSTLTAYPDAGSTGTTIDGDVMRTGVSEDFATIRAGAGNSRTDTGTQGGPFIEANFGAGSWNKLHRYIATFDTSTLTSGAIITDAVISFWGDGKGQDAGTPASHIGGATPASNNALVASDYGQCGSTSFANVAYASFDATNTVYTNYTLDSNGIANISKTGISRFCHRLSWDMLNNTTGLGGGGFNNSFFRYKFADQTGTSNDPKLVVTYTANVDYSLVLDQGSYSLTGQALALVYGKVLIAEQGSYALSGQDVLFDFHDKDIEMAMDQGSYALAGQDVLFNKTLTMALDQGSYSYTGQTVDFDFHDKDIEMTIEYGSYALTGYDIIFTPHFKYTEEGLQPNSFTKEALSINSFSKEARPTNSYTHEPLANT